MIIVSSEIAEIGVPQVDGRRYVTERHIDSAGGIHEATYLADADADLPAHLSATAAVLSETLPYSELMANVQQIATVYPPTVTTNFVTAADVNAAVRDAYAEAVTVAATLLGAYLAGLSDADLATCFGYANPSAELTALRNTVNAQLSLRNTALTQRGQ